MGCFDRQQGVVLASATGASGAAAGWEIGNLQVVLNGREAENGTLVDWMACVGFVFAGLRISLLAGRLGKARVLDVVISPTSGVLLWGRIEPEGPLPLSLVNLCISQGPALEPHADAVRLGVA